MNKKDETVVMCILGSGEVCEESCSLFNKCWNEEEMNKKKDETSN
jgi:hypothetical protein